MLNINIMIGDETRKEIEGCYGNSSYFTVETLVYDIIERYLNTEHFDPNLVIEDEDDNYSECSYCGEKAKAYRMFPTHPNELEEHCVCKKLQSRASTNRLGGGR
jgi:hypothetical protein